jgi:hypothetical protein
LKCPTRQELRVFAQISANSPDDGAKPAVAQQQLLTLEPALHLHVRGQIEGRLMKSGLSCLVAVVMLWVPSRGQDGSRTGTKAETQKSHDFVFEVQPRKIAAGEVAVLRWSIKGATKITIEEAPESGVGVRELRKIGTFEGSSGTLEVRPKESTTYVIACEGSTTYSRASVTVRVHVKQR